MVRIKNDQRAALDGKLKAMFRNVEQRPVPDALRDVVEQLEAAVERPARRAKKA